MSDTAAPKGKPAGSAGDTPSLLAEALAPDSNVQVLQFGTEAAVLLRGAPGLTGFFAGDIVSFGIGEAFEHVLTGLRTGALVVSAGRSRRRVTFRGGQVSFASSTEPYERLGAVLIRQKLVTPSQLKEALLEVKPGTPLGQVMTRTGWVPAPVIYKAMAQLVHDIVLELFTLETGSFVFLEGLNSKEAGIKLPQRLRELVLEGVKRDGEVTALRKQYPDPLRLTRGPSPKASDGGSLWRLAEEELDVAALRAKFEGGAFLFYSSLDTLVRMGALTEQGRPETAPPAASSIGAEAAQISERYGSIIRSVCVALKERGRGLSDLRSFLAEPLPGMEGAFTGVQLTDAGDLDVERIMQNMIQADPARGLARASEALNSFVSFVLFTTRSTLPEDLLRKLMADFAG